MGPHPVYTFKQFNDEMNDFYRYLKDNKYSDEEIRKIFAPLLPSGFKPNRTFTLIFILLSLLALLYFATYIETLSWHFSAIGRILLIRLLPFWNWPALKNSRCLIEKPITSPTLTEDILFNCASCESIQSIDVYDDIDSDLLKSRYLDIDLPVIVEKSFEKSETFIAALIDNPTIGSTQPCKLATNVANGVPDVRTLLMKTDLFDSFFLHFQNCDFAAVKEFRGAAPRPGFLPPELSPVQYNWLLWSRDYNASRFKEVGLVERVAVVGQIFGANFLKLVPRRNCAEECPVVQVRLKEGESLVLTSLWDLEYRPEAGENLAVILEMH